MNSRRFRIHLTQVTGEGEDVRVEAHGVIRDTAQYEDVTRSVYALLDLLAATPLSRQTIQEPSRTVH